MTSSELTFDKPKRRSLVRWIMQKSWRLTRSLTLGGQVCVIDDAGQVLLVRHGYRPGWHFPGGGVEFGESVRDAALRELEEEAGLASKAVPRLHGIFNNGAVFPGDHVAVFVLQEYTQVRAPKLGFEIAEVRFFAVSALPSETTAGTRQRIAEILHGAPVTQSW